jgi:hypothetical protein
VKDAGHKLLKFGIGDVFLAFRFMDCFLFRKNSCSAGGGGGWLHTIRGKGGLRAKLDNKPSATPIDNITPLSFKMQRLLKIPRINCTKSLVTLNMDQSESTYLTQSVALENRVLGF